MPQKHHICYDPDWIVELTGWQHKVVTHLQRLKPTNKNLEQVAGFLHAVSHEWNRIACQIYRAEAKNINPKIPIKGKGNESNTKNHNKTRT